MFRLLLAVSAVSAFAAQPMSELPVGSVLPVLKGEYLNGKKALLPDDVKGRQALLLMGFTYDSRYDVEAWAKAFRAQRIPDERVTFFEIPMIGGMGRMAKWFIDGGMRRGTPKEDHGHVITIYGAPDYWKNLAGMKNEKLACVILLNSDGAVQWKHSAGFSDAALAELMTAIR